MYICMLVRMYVCMYVGAYVCMLVRMYVCMYVCTYAFSRPMGAYSITKYIISATKTKENCSVFKRIITDV